MTEKAGPLARYKVLDFTAHRAGPTAVRHLADWGAVIGPHRLVHFQT